MHMWIGYGGSLPEMLINATSKLGRALIWFPFLETYVDIKLIETTPTNAGGLVLRSFLAL